MWQCGLEACQTLSMMHHTESKLVPTRVGKGQWLCLIGSKPNHCCVQSPRAVDGGLLKCFVTRERLRLGSVRFCMYLGTQSDSPATSKFLLAALQTSR